jgi:hypothetical protein
MYSWKPTHKKFPSYTNVSLFPTVPRRLFFATQQRIAISWRLKKYQKIRCSKRRNISKKNGEMSSNFGEIIRKLYFLVW